MTPPSPRTPPTGLASSERRPLLVVLTGPILLILVPAATFLIAASAGSVGGLPFVVIAVMHLLALAGAGWLALRGLRGREPWRAGDVVGPLLIAIGVGGSLVLDLLLADARGIRQGALFRVRHAMPLPEDTPFVLSVALAAAALVAAAVAAVGPAVRDRLQRRDREGRKSPSGRPVREPRPVRYATGPKDSSLTRLVSPVTRVLIVLSGLASLVCLLLFSLRPFDPDTAELLTIAVVFLPVLPMLWAVVETLWRLDAEIGPIMNSLRLTMAVPVLVSVVVFVPLMVVSLLPPIWRGFSTHHITLIGDGGLVAADAPVVGFLALGALTALGMGMVGGLAASVFVVIPAVAIFRPDVMIGENELDTAPEHRRNNIWSVRLLAALIVMIFVLSICLGLYSQDELPGWPAVVSLLVLVGLLVAVWAMQRVDHKARARSGTSARVRSPFDPKPAEFSESEEGPTDDAPDTSR